MPSGTCDSGRLTSGQSGRRESVWRHTGSRRNETRRSSRDLPFCLAVLRVLKLNAHYLELVANTVGFFEIFCPSSGITRFDQTDHLGFVDRRRFRTERSPLSL